MSDKKVGGVYRRPITPTEQMEGALSDPGTVNVADLPHDKGKWAIADKFREREERWRREQALHDQQAADTLEGAGAVEGEGCAEGEGGEKGGAL